MTWGEGTQHEMEINAKNVLQATAEDARRVVSIMAFHQVGTHPPLVSICLVPLY